MSNIINVCCVIQLALDITYATGYPSSRQKTVATAPMISESLR